MQGRVLHVLNESLEWVEVLNYSGVLLTSEDSRYGNMGVFETLCDGLGPPVRATSVVAVIALARNKTVRCKTSPTELMTTTTCNSSSSTRHYHGMTEIRTGHVVASTILLDTHPAARTRSDNPFGFLLLLLDPPLRLQSSLC